MEPGIPFSRLTSTESVSNEDELLLQQDNKTKRISYEDLKKPIEAETGNDIDLSIDESTVSLIATLKNKEGETIAEASVPLPNTTDLDMSVAEETAELTVSLKNKAGEVVTTATVQLPNTSNLEMSIDENNVLTTALKNKSGAVVTSDSVTIPAIQSRDVTWAEYEALPDSKLTDGVYYNIIDRNTMPDAEEIQGNKNFLGSVKVQGDDVVTKNNFILTREIDYGNVSMGTNNYLKLWEGDSNIEIISVALAYWSQNTDAFSIMPYRNNQVYLLMKSGTSIQSLRFKIFYIVKE